MLPYRSLSVKCNPSFKRGLTWRCKLVWKGTTWLAGFICKLYLVVWKCTTLLAGLIRKVYLVVWKGTTCQTGFIWWSEKVYVWLASFGGLKRYTTCLTGLICKLHLVVVSVLQKKYSFFLWLQCATLLVLFIPVEGRKRLACDVFNTCAPHFSLVYDITD